MYNMNELHKQRPYFFPPSARTRSFIDRHGWQDWGSIAERPPEEQLLAKIIAVPASKRLPSMTLEALDQLLHDLATRSDRETQRWCILAWLVQSGQIRENE